MIEFGKTLRAAREAKGLTTGQIAERTHMMVQTVEGLENENFSKIVAPIYGRGFVKLYCETVGLDPKPMVDAFMAIYSDRRAANAEPIPPPPPPPAASKTPQPEPEHTPAAPVAPEPPPKPAELDFGFPPPPPSPAPMPAPAPAARAESAPAPKQPTLSRYAASIPEDSPEPSFSLPYVNWRLVALVAGAFVVLLCVALGIRAIYRATMRAPVQETAATPEPQAAAQQPEPAGGKPQPSDSAPEAATAHPQPAARQPLPLKPFYIDSDHSTELERKK